MEVFGQAFFNAALFFVLPLVFCLLILVPFAAGIFIMRKVQDKQLQRALKELEEADNC